MNVYEKLLIVAAAKSAIFDLEKDLRAEASEGLEDGDQKRPTLNGLKLGSVSMPQSKVEAHIFNESAVADELGEGSFTVEPTISKDDLAEVLAVLAEHAPHLIREEVHLSREAVEDAKNRALKGEDIAGVVTQEKTPAMRVTASKEAKAEALQALAGNVAALMPGGGDVLR